jgi:hypothetical protein
MLFPRMWWREEKTVSRSTVSPLTSESHSVLGNPAGVVDAHLIHRLTVLWSLWNTSRVSLVLLQLGSVLLLLLQRSLLNHGICDS